MSYGLLRERNILILSMVPKRIGCLGFEGVDASHLAGPASTLAAAVLEAGYGSHIQCYQICIVGLTSEPFQTDSGVIFKPTETFETAPRFDTLVIPGGNGLLQPDVSEKISDWLLKHAIRTRRVAVIGSGIYGLAPTGLLDGREVTTHWRFASDVARRFPKLRLDHKRPLVKDGPFYTASGVAAAIDLSLALIEEDYGSHIALAAAQEIMIPLTHRNGQHELPKPVAFDSQPINRFGELVAWIMRNLHGDLSVDVLARRACMSRSHFNRAFKHVFGTAPAEFVENLRLNEARRRLSTPRKIVYSVAESVGFANPEAFRRAFERRFGAKPRTYLNDLETNAVAIPSNGKASATSPAEECQPQAAESARI
jgi:transcriptional regulator GlxA family with amidase domain